MAAAACATVHNGPMSDDSQLVVPPSFQALFLPPGRTRPSAARSEILARYELCEDLAQALVEMALARRAELGVTEADVLERIDRGLRVVDAPVSASEATWVLHRLAELLDWPFPAAAAAATR